MDDREATGRVSTWARTLQSIAQAGLTYARDAYDLERYLALRALAAEMLAAATGELPERVVRIVEAERGYLTPKVDVRAVVFRDGKVLMVREQTDDLWSLPGGWADVGASPGENAVREVREETGYVVRADKVVAVYDNAKHAHPEGLWYVYKLFVRCELLFYLRVAVRAGLRREVVPLPHEVKAMLAEGKIDPNDYDDHTEGIVDAAIAAARVEAPAAAPTPHNPHPPAAQPAS